MTHVDDGLTDHEASMIAAIDVLDTVHDILTRLSDHSRDDITTIIANTAPDYRNYQTLLERIAHSRDDLDQ